MVDSNNAFISYQNEQSISSWCVTALSPPFHLLSSFFIGFCRVTSALGNYKVLCPSLETPGESMQCHWLGGFSLSSPEWFHPPFLSFPRGVPTVILGLIKKARLIFHCSVLISTHGAYQTKPPIFNQVNDN